MVSKRKHELSHFETEIAADAQTLTVSLEKTFGGIEHVVAFHIFLQNIHHDGCGYRRIAFTNIHMDPISSTGATPLADRLSGEERSFTFDARDLIEPDFRIEKILHGDDDRVVDNLLLYRLLTDDAKFMVERFASLLVLDRSERQRPCSDLALEFANKVFFSSIFLDDTPVVLASALSFPPFVNGGV